MSNLFYLEADSLNVYHNQAIEKYLLDHCGSDSIILYLWQNENTVVIGKNQDAYGECKITELEKDGGRLARRISGGGAVYHDSGNLNFTFLTPKKYYDISRQDEVILKALRMLKIEAKKNDRNDLEIAGRKFSGHAYYQGKESCLHHGTLMLEVDENKLSEYLNVSVAKLQARKVTSVRSRIVNLKSIRSDLQLTDLKKALKEAFADVYQSSVSDYPIIDKNELLKLEKNFADPNWRYGHQEKRQYEKEKRFSWGSLKILYDLNGDIITDPIIYSDAMDQDIAEKILKIIDKRSLSKISKEGLDEKQAEVIGFLEE